MTWLAIPSASVLVAQPEPVAAGLIAARDAWRRAEPPRDAGLGAGDQAKHLGGDACRQTMTLDLVGIRCVQSYKPKLVPLSSKARKIVSALIGFGVGSA